MKTQTPDRVRQLIEAAAKIFGSEAKLGEATGYSQNAIWQAKKVGRVTGEMARSIDTVTNGAVARYELRPDLFDPPPPAAAPAQASA